MDAEPALKIMREGLEHPYMFPASRPSYTSFPGFSSFSEDRDLERVNAGAADYYAVSGEPGRAMQMRLDGLEMGVMIPRGTTLIGLLVGIACEAMAESNLETLIPRLSPAELTLAAARLDRISAKRVPYADIVLEDGYDNSAMLLQWLKDPKTKANPYKAALDITGARLDDSTSTWRDGMAYRAKALKFMAQSKSAMISENSEWHAAMAKEAQSVYSGPSRVPIPNNLIARMIGGMYNLGRTKSVSGEAALALLRVEVALFRFHKDQGKFPGPLRILHRNISPRYRSTRAVVKPCTINLKIVAPRFCSTALVRI